MGRGVHDLHTDTLKTVLSNTAPSADNQVLADIVEIAPGGGYTAGGLASLTNSFIQTAGVGKLLATNVIWASSGGGLSLFRYPVLYNSTPSNPLKPLIGYFDYGTSVAVLPGETFSVLYDGTNGVLTLA